MSKTDHFGDIFPDEHPAPGHQLMILENDGDAAGRTWVGPHPQRPGTSETAWLYNIEINGGLRGQGYGRSCLELVEAHLAQHGVTELGLNVFSDNDTARRSYTSSDYREVAVTTTKALPAPKPWRFVH